MDMSSIYRGIFGTLHILLICHTLFQGFIKFDQNFGLKKLNYHDHYDLIRSSQPNFQGFWKIENITSYSAYIRFEESF